jgi:tetratricopeptide (TPR) repeat protein
VLKVVNVFISYSEDDGKDLAEKLKRALEGIDTEISAFVAAKDIRVGVPWKNGINAALRDCDVFIPILTVAACRSEWVQREIVVAIEKETRTIPCVYKQVVSNMIPDIIEGLQRITFDNKYDLSRQVLALFTPSGNGQGTKKSEPLFPIDNSTQIAEYRKYIERFLRDFISEELEKHYGEGWWEERVPKGIREKCAGRKKDFIFKNMATEDDPDIDFADFPDYLEIFLFKNNWEDVFSDHYGKGKEAKYRIKDMFSQLYPIRSTEAHSREPSDEAVKRFEINALDLLCFDKAIAGFRRKIKELSGKRLLPPPEFDTAALHEIETLNDLYKVARDSNFLENTEENFKAKSKNIFYFGDKKTIDRISENIVDKLRSQKILFITGQPGVGKSTFMLFFLDKCLKEGIGEWQKVFFLNPRANKLKESLEIVYGEIEKSNKISPENVLLVIDALHREEDEEEYMEKCSELFTKILEKKYSLVATIRDSELDMLQEKFDRWAEFENIVEIEPMNPENAKIKQIFMNYLIYYDDKITLQDIDLSFEDIAKYVQEGEMVPPEKRELYQELDKCIRKVVEKSEGVPGYVKYLMDDISKKGELSTEIIEKYPAGMTKLIRRIIERDYDIGDDKVLPLLILFLAKEKGHALTWEFLSSFIEWGVDVIDKSRFDKEMILERARNLINYYTVDIHEGSITQHYLISHWREGIEDILKQKKIKKFTELEMELEDWILTYLAQKEEELKRGQFPVNLETWLVVADVAKLSYERKKMNVLKYATQLFTEYRDDTERCAFLKKALSSLWKEKMNEDVSSGDCENAAISLENAIEVGIYDASLHSLASDCYYEKGELSKALEHSQRAVELKPAEPTYLGKHGWILERVGADFDGRGNYTEALSKFEDAVKSYEEAVEIIEGLIEHEKGRRKRERNGYRWRIGYCNKRVELIRMRLKSEDEKYLKEKAEQCFRDGKNYETGGDYDTALKMFVDAKEWMSKYIEITEVFEEDIRNLVSSIYRRIGVCYENNRDYENNRNYEKAAEYYSIHADLNEYAPDSVDRYDMYGNKFRGWKLYGKAIYCFTKALKSDQNNYEFLSELADLSAKMGKLDDAVKYYKESLEEQKAVIGLITESDKEWLDKYKKRLEIRDALGNNLISICNIADLTLAGEEPWRLWREWYMAGSALRRSEKEKNSEELKNAQILCLWQAYSHNTKNQRVITELENLAAQSIEEIKKECMIQYREYIKPPPKPELGMKSPVTEVLHHLIYRTIQIHFHKRDEKKGQISGRKKRQQKNKLSSYWGWIGGRINRIYREDEYESKISPNVAVKCFELSLKLRERNKESSNGLGWALFYAGRYDEAIQAFNDDLREDMHPDSPASTIGIGSAYNKKGDYETAEKYLRKGAKLDFKFRYNSDPQKVIDHLKKSTASLEDLAFRCDSKNEKLRLLKEALDVYKMIGEIAQEIKLEDEQNLFKLEAANLEKYISSIDLGDLGGYNV